MSRVTGHRWVTALPRGWRCSAAVALGLVAGSACSASTDVVGVLDPAVDVAAAPEEENLQTEGADTLAPLPGAGEQDGAEDVGVLLVVGLPVPDWDGATSPWPLDTPLRSFFSEPSDGFSNSFSGSGGPGRGGPPGEAQREIFERMDVFSGEARSQMRFAKSTGVVADRLRDLFAGVQGAEDEPPSLVARDSWEDRYLVAVPAERCGRSGRRGGCEAEGAFESEHR